MSATSKKIRVVIPAHNAEESVQRCIAAVLVAVSPIGNCEVLVVDNDKHSSLDNILQGYPVTLIKRYKFKSAAYARNEGVAGLDDGIIIFIDSDVICEKNALVELIRPIQLGLCQATIGNYSQDISGLSFAQKYKQLYINSTYSRSLEIKNDFWTAIAAIDARVFRELGGFDVNYKGACGEDQELGVRLTKNGYKVQLVPTSVGQHISQYTILGIIKNDIRKGVRAVLNCLEKEVSLTHNRHAGKKEISAVITAVSASIMVSVGTIFKAVLPASLILIVLWVLLRHRFLTMYFAKLGIVSGIKSAFFMFFLDLVRCYCMVLGLTIFLLNNKRSTAPALKSELTLQE